MCYIYKKKKLQTLLSQRQFFINLTQICNFLLIVKKLSFKKIVFIKDNYIMIFLRKAEKKQNG